MKILPDSPSIPMGLKNFKYIGRVFLCKLSSIDLLDLSDEVQDCVNDADTDKYILLSQVIDAAQKVEQGWGFQFYALGQEDDSLKLSGPVKFHNEMTKAEDDELVGLRSTE